MTNAEKLLLKDPEFKEDVINVLSLFRNKSHQHVAAVLRAALRYVSANAVFNFERTASEINAFVAREKKN